jgi:integrase
MFRNKKLIDIKAYDLIAFYNTKRSEGLKDASIKKVANIMHPALRNAFHLELIARDITAQIPNFKESRPTINYFDKNELGLFLEVIKGHKNELAFKLAAYYGFRRSEIIGLKWDAVDFERKTITIKHKVIISERKIWTSDKLKTESSFRTLPLIPEIEKELLKQKERIKSNKKYFGNSYDETYKDYIIINEMGKILFPDNLTHQFKLVLKRHKLKEIRFHDLRHSCASLLLSTGIHMKQIQEWLGHADFSTTANIYSHLDYSSKIESAKNIASALQGVYADKEERTLADKKNTDFIETPHDPLKNKRKQESVKAKEKPVEQKNASKTQNNDAEFLEFLEWKKRRQKQSEDEM